MIIRKEYKKGLNGDEPGIDTEFYGDDFLVCPNKICNSDYLNKPCNTSNNMLGTIIGFEEANSCDDYYYIVFVPKLGKVVYELANNSEFIKSIVV